MGERFSRFDNWPTGTKLLLILSAALLPLGMALAWAARSSLEAANNANRAAAEEQGRAVAQAIESLIARNALALGVAANGAFRDSRTDLCAATARSLALTPAIANRFVIRDPDGTLRCSHGDIIPRFNDRLVGPGAIGLWVSPADRMVDYRTGVVGGIATGELTVQEIRAEIEQAVGHTLGVSISDGTNALTIIDDPAANEADRRPLRRVRRRRQPAALRAGAG